MSKSLKTLMIGAAVAGLMAGTSNSLNASVTHSGKTLQDSSFFKSKKEKHACKGQNSCKGKGGCKTSDNGCKGKNSCKGKGGCATDGSKMPS